MIEASTPACAELFFIYDTKSQVEEQRKKSFHRLECRLIWYICRGQKDLQTTIQFLSKRNFSCNEHDYRQLRRLVHCIHSVIDLEAFIGIEDIGKLVKFIDASCAVHANMRSNFGGSMTFGMHCFSSMSKIHSLNTKSSADS